MYLEKYNGHFKVQSWDNSEKAHQYLCGLFHEGKHNIERMNERIEKSEYQQLHHFISMSPWEHGPVIKAVSSDISGLFAGRSELKGLILDESGHRKGGKKSVGVARQYLGSIGKVDNGQVAVFAALGQGDDVGMVGARLYLPKEWADDEERCRQAGIPEGHRGYKTKPVLGLEMIEQVEGAVCYDWVGGDCVHGNSKELRQGIHGRGKLFVMDVSEKRPVYLEHPMPYLPGPGEGRGRNHGRYISDQKPVTTKGLFKKMTDAQWGTYTVRQGTKGALKRKAVVLEVYVWKAKGSEKEPERLRLIISCNADGSEVEYSLTNDISLRGQQQLPDRGLLYRQMQRYWVERGIQECKGSLGMTDYQVRGWRAWHHHITLTIMALHYMLEQKVLHEEDMPLLSCTDIKFFFAMNLPKKADSPQKVWELILKRHKQRQKDLDRFDDS